MIESALKNTFGGERWPISVNSDDGKDDWHHFSGLWFQEAIMVGSKDTSYEKYWKASKRAWQNIQIHLASSSLLIHISNVRECNNNVIDVESITTNLLFDKHQLGSNGETRKLRLKDIS
jgi:hypothetical protein